MIIQFANGGVGKQHVLRANGDQISECTRTKIKPIENVQVANKTTVFFLLPAIFDVLNSVDGQQTII